MYNPQEISQGVYTAYYKKRVNNELANHTRGMNAGQLLHENM